MVQLQKPRKITLSKRRVWLENFVFSSAALLSFTFYVHPASDVPNRWALFLIDAYETVNS